MALALVAILSAVIVIIVVANQRLIDTRNTARETDTATILSAVTRYAIDNEGKYPSTITTTSTEICRTDSLDCSGLIDLSVLTKNGQYLDTVPADPQSVSLNGTGYYIQLIGRTRVRIDAPLAESDAPISKSQ